MLSAILEEDLQRIDAAIRPQAGPLEGSVVLVTGCAGFLGCYLLQYLVRYAPSLGVRKVIGLDSFLLGTPVWLETLKREFRDVLQLHKFDVSRDRLDAVKGATGANFVVHMASIASPSFYRRYPLETIDANVWGLRRLLDTYSGAPALRGLLFFSSSEVYGDPDPAHIPTSEEYRGNVASIGPRACYDEAKRFGETLCHVFANKHDMPITIVRPFNNYGPGMHVDDRRLPADFAKAVLANRDIEILSDGSPTRTFCYISDAVAGYLLCLLSGRFDYYNIGVEEPEISVAQLAEIYRDNGRQILGYRGRITFARSQEKDYLTDNPNRRCPVIAKAREQLGYDPRVLVDEGVRRYLEYLKHEKAAVA